MTKLKRAAEALSFAHLAGVGARAEDDKNDGHDIDDGGKHDVPAEASDGDDDKDYGRRAKKAKKADDGADDEDDGAGKDDLPGSDDGDEDDDGDSKGKRAKKAKRAEDPEDEEEDEDREIEMRGSSAIAKARRREQARCAAIFGCAAAGRNPELAANLAFKTRMARDEAIAILEATPGNRSAQGVNADRSARNPAVSGTGGPQVSAQHEIAKSWDRAFAAVAPQRRK